MLTSFKSMLQSLTQPLSHIPQSLFILILIFLLLSYVLFRVFSLHKKPPIASFVSSFRPKQWITKTKTISMNFYDQIKSSLGNIAAFNANTKKQEFLLEKQREMISVLALVVMKIDMEKRWNFKTGIKFPSLMTEHKDGAPKSAHRLVEQEKFNKELELFKNTVKDLPLNETFQYALLSFLQLSVSTAIGNCKPQHLPCIIDQLYAIMEALQWTGTNLLKDMKKYGEGEHPKEVRKGTGEAGHHSVPGAPHQSPGNVSPLTQKLKKGS